MLEANGVTFEDDDLAGACIELTDGLSTEKMNDLFDKIRDEFQDEYRNARQLMAKEGAVEMSISFITDCIGNNNIKKFFKFVKKQC